MNWKGQEIDAKEFQNCLQQFFDKTGIMNDLRSHLRSQLILKLNETQLGKSLNAKQNDISPKVHAINLLIAEHLLHANYHYTLSVLCSEVPLNYVFPSLKMKNGALPKESFRFSNDDLWDILNSLGATSVPDVAESLGAKYNSQTQLSLLTCILQSVSGVAERNSCLKSKAIRKWIRNNNNMHKMDAEHLIRMFKDTDVDVDTIVQIIELLKTVITNEVAHLTELKDQEVMRLKEELGYEAATKLQKYKVKFAGLEAFYKSEKNRLQDELDQAKETLSTSARHVQDKYKDVAALNEHIKSLEMRLMQQEQTLILKEQSLQQRQESLECKQKQFDERFELMQKNFSQTNQMAISVGNESKQQETQKIDKDADIRAKAEAAMMMVGEQRLKIENLQSQTALNAEIAVLRHQNSEYKLKIQELLTRTSSLMVQLEARNDYQWNWLIEGDRSRRFGPNANFRLGNEDQKHSILELLQEYIICEESMPDGSTEEILLEARQRLLELERESDVIDEHFESVTKFPASPYEYSASIIIKKFQNNIAMLRDSLKNMFSKKSAETDAIDGGRESGMKQKESVSNLGVLSVIQSQNVENCKLEQETKMSHSPDSSILNIDTSLSTINVSLEDDTSVGHVELD